MDAEVEWEDEEETEPVEVTPDTVERRCTDVLCLFGFLLVSAAFGFVVSWSLQSGSLRRLQAFDDGTGRACGIMPGVEKEMFLFFCRNASDGEGLDVQHPVCVAVCPAHWNSTVEECEGDGADEAYPTEGHMNMLCRPLRLHDLELPAHAAQGEGRMQEMTSLANQAEPWATAARNTVLAKIIIERWPMLVTSGFLAVMVSYSLIWVLERCAGPLVKFGLCFLSLVPAMAGAYCQGFYAWLGFKLGVLDLLIFLLPPTEYQPYGYPLLSVGLLFTFMSCKMWRSVTIATDCIEMSCTCVLQTPTLILHPLIVVVTYVSINSFMIYVALLLLSCGRRRTLIDVNVEFMFTPLEQVYVLIWVIFFFWVHQSIFMVSEFVVAYATALWCLHGGLRGEGCVPKCTVARAYWSCLRYHLGTCMYGAFAIGLIRPVSLTLGGFVAFLQVRGNPVGHILRACCCCSNPFENWIRPVNKIAYVDVVMSAAPFCEAARQSLDTVKKQDTTVRVLNGATWIIQVAAVAFNAGVGAIVTIIRCETSNDDNAVTLVIAAAAAIVAVLVALPFAMIFDTVSDTILYCLELQRQRELQVKAKERHAYCAPCLVRGLEPFSEESSCVRSTYTLEKALYSFGLGGLDDHHSNLHLEREPLPTGRGGRRARH